MEMTDTNRTGATLVALFALPLLLVASCGPSAWAVDLSGGTYRLEAGDRMILCRDGSNQSVHRLVRSDIDPWEATGQDDTVDLDCWGRPPGCDCSEEDPPPSCRCGEAEPKAAWLARYGVYFAFCDRWRDDGHPKPWIACWGQHGIDGGLRRAFQDRFVRDWRNNGRERLEVHLGAGLGFDVPDECPQYPGCTTGSTSPPGCLPPQPGSGWSVESLSVVPVAQRPPEAEIRDLNAGNSEDECRCWRFDSPTWWGSPARLTVNFRRSECFPPSWPPPCRVVEGLTADCWESDPPPPPEPFCGDGTCDGDETCDTCLADCGECPDPPPPAGDLELVGVFCHEEAPGDWRYLVRILTGDLDLVDLVSSEPAPLCAARELVCGGGS